MKCSNKEDEKRLGRSNTSTSGENMEKMKNDSQVTVIVIVADLTIWVCSCLLTFWNVFSLKPVTPLRKHPKSPRPQKL